MFEVARKPQKEITAVTVNFKTPQLFKGAVTSFRKCHPNLPYILIDNGGCQKSVDIMKELAKRYSNITLVFNEENEGHGPALHYAAKLARTRFLFTLDSDTETKKCGFLEPMLKHFERNDKLLAVGWKRWVNRNGVAHPSRTKTYCHEYIHPYAALYDLDKYFMCDPFKNRGAPAINLMLSGKNKGYRVMDFPIQNYLWHKVAGTRGMFRGQYKDIPTAREPEPWRYHKI